MITKITGEQPFQVLTNNFSISPSQEGYTLQISADGKQYSNLFSVGAGVTRLVTGVAANSYYRLLGNQSQVSINWMKTCVTEGGSGSGTELAPVTEFPLDAAEGTVVALASGDTVGLYQYIDGEWVLVGADDPTKLLAVNELPASAEPGTVMALYQEGEAGGGTWVWDEASEEYVFNCNFSTLDTAATYDLGSPLGSDVGGCYSYGNINLHYDNGWKVTTNYRICGNDIDEQACENQGGTWICSEGDDWCNCSLYRTIELSPSTDPNNGFESEDICYDYDEDAGEETERWMAQRFYWDPADLKLKYVMNDGDTHYRYDCSGVPDLRNITGGTPSEPILGLYQYNGTAWNEVIDLSAYWTSAQTKDYVDSASTVLQEQIDTMDEVVSEALVDLNERIDNMSGSTGGGDILLPSTGFSQDDELGSVRSVNGTEGSWAYWVQTVRAASTSVTYTYYQSVPSELTGNVATIGYHTIAADKPFIEVNKTLSSLAVDYSGLTSNTYTIDYSNATSGETNDYLRFNMFANFYCKFNIKWQINGSNLVVEITLSRIPDEEPLPSGASGQKWDPLTQTSPYRVDIYLIGEDTPGIPGGVKVLTADGAKTLATEDYVSAATSGKADAVNIEANAGGYFFPGWNRQGIITGNNGMAYTNNITINGVSKSYWGRGNGNPDPFYAPTTSGNPGEVLVADGTNTPKWSAMPAADVTKAYVDSADTALQEQIDTMDDVVSAALVDLNDRKVESASVSTIWKGTQAQYDAIVTKDASTLYIIVNNS